RPERRRVHADLAADDPDRVGAQALGPAGAAARDGIEAPAVVLADELSALELTLAEERPLVRAASLEGAQHAAGADEHQVRLAGLGGKRPVPRDVLLASDAQPLPLAL